MSHEQVSAISRGFILCHCCNAVSENVEKQKGYTLRCPRCNSAIHARKTDSVRRTWVFVIVGYLVFLPSHLFPVMSITQLGSGTVHKTIMGGVIAMFEDGFWGLGSIVFIASVVVPLFKLLALSYILFAVQYRWLSYRYQLTRLYRVVAFIGRWSMVDVFVAAVMVSLLQVPGLITIDVGFGATAFGFMCVITMVASEFFDPRLLWDREKSMEA